MSIEKNIERIADALERIANHLKDEAQPKQTKVTPKKPAVEKKEDSKKPIIEKEAPPKKTPKKVTVVSDVQEALVRVANEAGRDVARGIVAEFDGALKVADLQESDYDAVIALCEKTLKEAVGA